MQPQVYQWDALTDALYGVLYYMHAKSSVKEMSSSRKDVFLWLFAASTWGVTTQRRSMKTIAFVVYKNPHSFGLWDPIPSWKNIAANLGLCAFASLEHYPPSMEGHQKVQAIM